MKVVSREGFTLLEILLSLVIIGVGLCGVLGGLYVSVNFLKQADNKQKAMQTASLIMESNLAKAYTALSPSNGTQCLGPDWESSNETEESCINKGGKPFNWNVNIVQKEIGGIPYKEIETTVSYKEKKVKKTVRLLNMRAYPYVHIKTLKIGSDINQYISNVYQPIASIDIDFPVKKDIEVSYNIAIKIDNAEGLTPIDIILTRCLIDGEEKPIETGTPFSQPLINNWVEIDDVPPGPHTITVEWRKSTRAGDIRLKMGNIILIAIEG